MGTPIAKPDDVPAELSGHLRSYANRTCPQHWLRDQTTEESTTRMSNLNHLLARAKSTPAYSPAADTRYFNADLAQLIRDASSAMPFRDHIPAGMYEPTHRISQPAATAMSALLASSFLPDLIDKDGRITRVPAGVIAGQSTRLDAAIIANSRVAQAGAQLIVMPESTEALPTGLTGDIVLVKKPGSFRTIEAANFDTVSEGDGPETDAPIVAMPVSSAPINFGDAISKGISVTVKRSSWKETPVDILAADLALALTLGLARAADEVLLRAIAAGNPSAFSLSSAAAQGLEFGELRALAGGDGAVVDQSGVLRVAGVPAELTADNKGTIVGAFSRAAVVVHERIDLIAHRLDTAGSVNVTCWASFVPCVPDVSKFWSAKAN